ncbi:winged helix-turn-helix domain-containing protein [Streptomyces mexicanus]|uniref:winged helix-turn-helix domain-containing protein n=1 Tax=Streptomyces mexicanus TaxID=178566 RepID=UPI00135CC77F|nr:winged helix-turn-helix domain-containing protein [Streptomyces mexicanus]
MATTRSLTTATATATAAALAASAPAPAPAAPRHRLRAVDRDEDWTPARPSAVESLGQEVADLLPPGATWLPAPQHTLPSLPGRPPMVGYLVLVPADRQPPFAPAAAPDAAAPAADAGDALGRIDTVRRTAEVAGRPPDLTYLEFELLAHLVAHPHRVHSRDQLVTTVWGYGHVGDGRTVDVHIARLRRKLGAEHRTAIQTVRRAGYKYVPPTER